MKCVISILIFITLISCASTGKYIPSTKVPLNLQNKSVITKYKIKVEYDTKDFAGNSTEKKTINAVVEESDEKGNIYVKWTNYEISVQNKKTNETFSFIPAKNFDYILRTENLGENPDVLGYLPNVDSIPRTMDGLQFYLNLIDFQMWEIYKRMIVTLDKMSNKDSIFSMENKNVSLKYMDWQNLMSDLKQTLGEMKVKYIANDGDNKIFYFVQEQQITQFVYGFNFKMPYKGFNQYSGYMSISNNNKMNYANFIEFVAGEVSAPFFQKVQVITERKYEIEKYNN
jgi:hypothetical protein